MSKDQAIGAIIFAVCVIVAMGYVILVSIPSYIGLNTATIRLDAPTTFVKTTLSFF
jgi:hypothetical protein